MQPRPTVLVVDDERQIVKLIEINLRKVGYNVICAYDGEEALEKAAAKRPHLIILDVMLPHMNGFDVLKRLQRDPDTRHIPVIMLTAEAQDADIFAGWQSGVSSYLTKPFDPRELLRMVDEAPGQWVHPALLTDMPAKRRARRANILLVCSDQGAARKAAKALRRARHHVRVVPDLEAAKEASESDCPESIVLLPFVDASAEDTRSRLRSQPPTSHVPVLEPKDQQAVSRLAKALKE